MAANGRRIHGDLSPLFALIHDTIHQDTDAVGSLQRVVSGMGMVSSMQIVRMREATANMRAAKPLVGSAGANPIKVRDKLVTDLMREVPVDSKFNAKVNDDADDRTVNLIEQMVKTEEVTTAVATTLIESLICAWTYNMIIPHEILEGKPYKIDPNRNYCAIRVIFPHECKVEMYENNTTGPFVHVSGRTTSVFRGNDPLALFVRMFGKISPTLHIPLSDGARCVDEIRNRGFINWCSEQAMYRILNPVRAVHQVANVGLSAIDESLHSSGVGIGQSDVAANQEVINTQKRDTAVKNIRNMLKGQFEDDNTAGHSEILKQLEECAIVMPPNTTLHREESDMRELLETTRQLNESVEDRICRSIATLPRNLLYMDGNQQTSGPALAAHDSFKEVLELNSVRTQRILTEMAFHGLALNEEIQRTNFFEAELNAMESESARDGGIVGTDIDLALSNVLAFYGTENSPEIREMAFRRQVRLTMMHKIFNLYMLRIAGGYDSSNAPTPEAEFQVKLSTVRAVPLETLRIIYGEGLITHEEYQQFVCSMYGLEPSPHYKGQSMVVQQALMGNPLIDLNSFDPPENNLKPGAKGASAKKKPAASKSKASAGTKRPATRAPAKEEPKARRAADKDEGKKKEDKESKSKSDENEKKEEKSTKPKKKSESEKD